MTTTKPTQLPEWATDESLVVDPEPSKKVTGWVVGEKPPAQSFNWHQNLTYKWLDWIDRQFDMETAGDMVLKTDIRPGTDDTIALGTASYRFEDIYATAMDATTLTAGTVNATTVNTTDLDATSMTLTSLDVDELTDNGAGSITLTSDVLPTDSTYDLGGPSNAFAEVHGDVVRAGRVEIQNTATSAVSHAWEQTRNNTVVACGFMNLNATYQYELNLNYPNFNVDQVNSGNFFYTGTDNLSTVSANGACRIRLTTAATNKNYNVVVTQNYTDSTVAGINWALGEPLDDTDGADLQPSFRSFIAAADISTVTLGIDTLTGAEGLLDGDILIRPYAVDPDTAGDAISPIWSGPSGGHDISPGTAFTSISLSPWAHRLWDFFFVVYGA